MLGDWLRRWIAAGRPRLVVVWRARSLVEAQLLEAVLHQAGISVLVRPRSLPGYEGVVERAQGIWADLLVEEPNFHQARAIAEEFLGTGPPT